MDENSLLFVVGDIHGHLEKMARLLRYAGLVNAQGDWLGGNAQLWFMGDFTDRGPDGIGVIDFVMRLRQNAAMQGGTVGALMGNHDVGILSAHLFPYASSGGPRGTMYGDWVQNGGKDSDLHRLEARHVEWLQNLTAMALVQNHLLVHADALFYLNFGDTVEQVNAAMSKILHGNDAAQYDYLLSYAGERLAFSRASGDGSLRARQFLAQFGGKQIIHGHTPIPLLNNQPYDRVTRAFEYTDGLVVDVDGGIYKGGTGFVYEAAPI